MMFSHPGFYCVVAEAGGRVVGSNCMDERSSISGIGPITALAFFGHATAETNTGLQALIGSAESFGGPGILLPSRNSALLRWCLANGLRVVQPMTLMSIGLYNEPAGSWLPGILF